MDDPRVAFPVFEKAQELGVNLIGVHKGVPLGPQPIEATQTWDMDGAAANFPDINFVIFHVGLPFIDEVCWQLIRHPNLYASIAATVNIPQDLVEGYGYPQLTEQAKRKILGENLLRLHGMDVEATRARLRGA